MDRLKTDHHGCEDFKWKSPSTAYLHAGESVSPESQRSGSAPAQSWLTASASGHGRPAEHTHTRVLRKHQYWPINVGGMSVLQGKIKGYCLPSSPTWDLPPSLARPEPTQIWPAGRERVWEERSVKTWMKFQNAGFWGAWKNTEFAIL